MHSYFSRENNGWMHLCSHAKTFVLSEHAEKCITVLYFISSLSFAHSNATFEVSFLLLRFAATGFLFFNIYKINAIRILAHTS